MTSSVSELTRWSSDETVRHATPDQVRFFREQGYLKFGRIFTASEMDALAAHVDEMIAALPEGKRPESMDVPHFNDPWLFRYLLDDRVLDVIDDFIGPDIILWSSHFIAKPKGDGKVVPWHTDGAYWTDRIAPMEVITMWLAVDPASTKNGCMRVIPGSHVAQRNSMDAYEEVDRVTNVFPTQIRADLCDETRAVDLELRRGECTFHDAWTLHGSNANTSERRRCGYTMRYMPAHVVVNHDTYSSHRVYLARGSDRTGGRNIYAPVPD